MRSLVSNDHIQEKGLHMYAGSYTNDTSVELRYVLQTTMQCEM